MLEEIVKKIAENFPDDPSQPSLVLSALKNGKYYGSVVRYTESFGGGKQVTFKTMKDTVDEVLKAIMEVL